ncbi:hypothetical protein EV649_4345 [Kribbella sp. VKM Ac-2569]|uniref:hypothetical protein n=1 Tax=Kribbella sp. VKM Ac-2569 TaxID=2512220 RepID=UPI00102AEB8F|nr:hypothetical protein [Kribbella sp. VKM Ac-2569]RZT16812.1 hypothetical protein EV649_4345 [Kribbella sp. VKM Ac-2569]
MTARLPWLICAGASVVGIPAAVVVTTVGRTGPMELLGGAGFALAGLGAAAIGAVVASRLPRHAVGWILLALGVGIDLPFAPEAYAELSLVPGSGPLPGDEWAAWVSSWATVPAFFGLTAFLFMLFPTGRLPSRRWRWAGWFVAVSVALATVAVALAPDEIDSGFDNPVAPTGRGAEFARWLSDATDLLAAPVLVIATAALVVRLRRSGGVERQQLKWFTYAAVMVGAGIGAGSAMPPGRVANAAYIVGLLAVAGLPVAAGLAVLRYRLYDIDLVINKTLVYGALTVTLGTAYLGSVLLLQVVLGPVTQGSGLAVAVSTLAVAALFRPVRSRIQAGVDRRFFRRRYDAARTLDAFGARLRHELDLQALAADLRTVVHDTMQPTHVSLWLRTEDRNDSRTTYQ